MPRVLPAMASKHFSCAERAKNEAPSQRVGLAPLEERAVRDADPVPSWKKMWERITTEAWFVPITTDPGAWYVTKSLGGVTVTLERFGSPVVTEWSWK